VTRIYSRGPAIARIIEHVILHEDGCWIVDGAKTPAGYAHVNLGNGRYQHSHIVTFEHFRGSVPEGLELDHLCRVRDCVNPWHLEAVTHRENCLRGEAPTMLLHLEGRCKNGHPASEAVRRRSTGRVVYCKACRREKRAAQS
jgi:hypothetical protein